MIRILTALKVWYVLSVLVLKKYLGVRVWQSVARIIAMNQRHCHCHFHTRAIMGLEAKCSRCVDAKVTVMMIVNATMDSCVFSAGAQRRFPAVKE